MDPISAIFASYLDLVSNTAHEHVSDVMGTEITALVVKHDGISIPYTYQIWKVKEKSVCATYEPNIAHYSKCTVAAKSLFNDICQHLQENKANNWKHKKLKNMYCNAAITYQPTVASVDWTNKESPLRAARAECNLAIAGLMGSTDSELLKKKEEACGNYQTLKQKANN